jgi:uncharacterized protein YndB with AHSA1/START domain
MAANKEVIVNTEGSTLTLSREFDAPRDLVFKAYSDCEHLSRWWAPAGWSMTHCDLEFRSGGRWHYCMSADDEDMQSWGLARYTEITAPESIKYTDHFSDEDANPNPDMPSGQIAVTLSEKDGVTTLISRTTYDKEEDLQQILEMGVVEGVTETWDKLETLLAEEQS